MSRLFFNRAAHARLARRWYPALLAAVGLALFIPRLGAFGFWDPYEIRIADAARVVTTTHHWSFLPQPSAKPPALVCS